MAEGQLDCARGRACREFGGVGRWATLFIRFVRACMFNDNWEPGGLVNKILDP